jgi:DNA repair exonuclease SbcCD nuclease subunit
MIDGVYHIAKDAGIDLVVVAGDIVDRPDLLPQEKDMLIDRIAYYDQQGFRTVFLVGNHDLIEMNLKGMYSHIRTIKHLVDRQVLKNTWVIESSPKAVWFTEKEDKDSASDILFLGIPGGFDGKVDAIVDMEYRRARLDRKERFKFVVIMHELISGATTDFGYRFENRYELDTDTRVDYFALGDVHKPQQVSVNAWYCGSPVQHNFGDELPRGVFIVDLDHDVDGPELVPLDGIKPLVSVNLEDVDDLEEDAYVRVVHKPGEVVPPVPGLVTTKLLVDNSPPTEIVANLNLDTIFSGIEELLAQEGLPEEEQREAVRLLTDMQIAIGVA